MSKALHIIVSVSNDLVTDQRVHKVCLYLHQKGHAVTLVGRKKRKSKELEQRAYQTKRFSFLPERGPFFYACFNLRLFFYLLFKKSDVFVSNDLDTLLANYRAAHLRNKKLVYDTHEYFTEVPELINRPRVQKIWERIERKIFPKLKHIYTVNSAIASLYEAKYKVPVHVVRNIASFNGIRKNKSRTDLNLPEDKKIIIIQGAGINIDRGNEEMVEAMTEIENAILLIIGDGDVVHQLKNQVRELHLTDKIRFIDKMPYAELMQYTLNSDLGISVDKDTNLNYRLSLPNKLFDFIHAGIPVFSSDLPLVSEIVTTYQIGEVCESHDPKVIAQKINRLFADNNRIEEYKSNTEKAKQDFTWEKECLVLDKIYNTDNLLQ